MISFILSAVRQEMRLCERMERLALFHRWMPEILSFMSSTQDLMRELDEKEEAIKSVQDKAERLMIKSHPARLTIEVSSFFFLYAQLCGQYNNVLVSPPCIQLPQ